MHAYRDQYAQLFHDGQDVILIAISTDAPEAQAAWAADDQFQFVFASDPESEVGRAYGAFRRAGLNNRNLFVVGPDGRIAYRQIPFRETDPTAYEELGAAIDSIAGTRAQ